MKQSLHNAKDTWRICILLMSAVLVIYFLSVESITPVCLADEGDNVQGQEIDFTSLSLEELKQVMIVSILKQPQKLSEATSAISVITQDDIRRSGATSIPDLLRSVPGFEVAQINSSTWAVSSRGFNLRKANKLLVLMDGRSLYTPHYSGVYWNIQDTLLADIERIEVIRGPGAALWGANAVNGVINIITKKAEDTQGGMVTSGLGNEKKRFGAFRYGIPLWDNAYGRFYVKYFERDGSVYANGNESNGSESNDNESNDNESNDNWDSVRSGGRVDWSTSNGDTFTLQSDIYQGKNREEKLFFDQNNANKISFPIDFEFSGGNLLGRWGRTFSVSSDMALQFYYDRTKQVTNFGEDGQFIEKFDIFDLDFQHNFAQGNRQEIIWGLGYRFIKDRFEAKFIPSSSVDSKTSNTDIVSAFFQDGISIVKERLQLTIGSKFEHNDYTGFEIQPSLRILWKLAQTQNLWASVSRAVRTPSHYEECKFTLEKSRDIGSEELIAYELGYRWQPTGVLSFDLATFYNDYDDLMIAEDFMDRPPRPGLYLPLAEAENYGFELTANWNILKWWRLRLAYSYLNMNVTLDKNDFPPPDKSNDPNNINYPPPPPLAPLDTILEGNDPMHQLFLKSSMDLLSNLEFDIGLRYVDDLFFIDRYIESYVEIDVRVGWRPREYLELSIGGENLLNSHHPEFGSMGHHHDSAGGDLEVERSVYGKIICRF